MSSDIRRRVGGVCIAVAVASALVAHGPAASADVPDPFEDLFGDSGFNAWTPTADAALLNSDAPLAASLDTSVENFLGGLLGNASFPDGDTPFSYLLSVIDPSAFTGDFGFGIDGGVPDNGLADLAVGLDYTLFATGIAGNEVGLWDLLTSIESIPAEIGGLAFLFDLLLSGLFL
ncbi:hypothetical protein [Mycobacterium paraterrae]|uniref:PE-PGRS family protein n=1 Tax=Mycobacterium paraterrae TaxID=577492 RepID=A0ABY3VGT8_9MYCO|nr:hypothetical protein [Mycobacterium paraterrae]UMB68563.1 hypothetical protein MKK62_19425 [Mycobacterium paraterrae]